MDTEFINIYISKQKALIDELQVKLILSETHQQVLKNSVQNLTDKLNEANNLIEQLNKKNQRKTTGQDA